MPIKSWPRPILVTGAHRSGTTWVGRMLCLSKEAGYIDEPFNRLRVPGWMPKPVPYWYQYVHRFNEGEYLEAMAHILTWRYPWREHLRTVSQQGGLRRMLRDAAEAARHRRAARLPLIKDPLALFSAPWMADRLGMRVVVLVRHPAAFASSLKRLRWHFDFRNWTEQPQLMRDWLRGYAASIEQAAREPNQFDILDEAILLWNAIYSTVQEWRKQRPDFVFIRYEALAEDPVQGMRWLYHRLGLHFTPQVARAIARMNSSDQPGEVPPTEPLRIERNSRAAKSTWLTRLDSTEIGRVKAGTYEVARHFYRAADWPEVIPFPTARRHRL